MGCLFEKFIKTSNKYFFSYKTQEFMTLQHAISN